MHLSMADKTTNSSVWRLGRRKTVILGTGYLAQELASEIISQSACGYELLGLIAESEENASAGIGYQCLGSMRELQQILERHKSLHIIVAPDRRYAILPMDRLVESQIRREASIENGADAYERLTGKLAIEVLTAGSILFVNDFNPSPLMHRFSRVSSFLAASLLLPPLLPVMALLGLIIKLESPGPILFVQDRIGLAGKRFRLFKFRSMLLTNTSHSEWELDNVGRITRSGRWLRRFRLDELPQLFNVLRGDMNLVGPRPHPSSNRDLFTLVSRNAQEDGEQIPYYSLRCSVRPGITGWAQVRYKYANGIDEEIEKLRYDLYYIKHYTPLLDLRILYRTVKIVLLGHTAARAARRAPSYPQPLTPVPPEAKLKGGRQPASYPETPAVVRQESDPQLLTGSRDGSYWNAKPLKVETNRTHGSIP